MPNKRRYQSDKALRGEIVLHCGHVDKSDLTDVKWFSLVDEYGESNVTANEAPIRWFAKCAACFDATPFVRYVSRELRINRSGSYQGFRLDRDVDIAKPS